MTTAQDKSGLLSGKNQNGIDRRQNDGETSQVSAGDPTGEIVIFSLLISLKTRYMELID